MKIKIIPIALCMLLGCSQSPVRPNVDREKIRAVIQDHTDEIKGCYEKALKDDPNIRGKLVILWTIGGAGRVYKAEVKSSDLKSSAIESCALEKSKKWIFPSPPIGVLVDVSFPYLFTPEDDNH